MEVIIQDNTFRIATAADAAIARGLKKVGMAAEKYAVDNVNKLVYDTPPRPTYPVRTGDLRRGITHELIGKDSVAVGDTVDYAIYVEYGTRHMEPRPFIKPAALDHLTEYKNTITLELLASL